MMRAWAAISAAAVLVALPVSVERAADSVAANAPTPATVADTGIGGNAAGLTASNLGVLIWLAVAVLAVIVAVVVLRHSRTQAAADAGLTAVTALPVGSFAFSEFSGPTSFSEPTSTVGGR